MATRPIHDHNTANTRPIKKDFDIFIISFILFYYYYTTYIKVLNKGFIERYFRKIFKDYLIFFSKKRVP